MIKPNQGPLACHILVTDIIFDSFGIVDWRESKVSICRSNGIIKGICGPFNIGVGLAHQNTLTVPKISLYIITQLQKKVAAIY